MPGENEQKQGQGHSRQGHSRQEESREQENRLSNRTQKRREVEVTVKVVTVHKFLLAPEADAAEDSDQIGEQITRAAVQEAGRRFPGTSPSGQSQNRIVTLQWHTLAEKHYRFGGRNF